MLENSLDVLSLYCATLSCFCAVQCRAAVLRTWKW